MAERKVIVGTIALWIIRVILAALFIYAGVIKALDPAGLLADIEGYRLVPYSVAWVGAYYLPYVEILAGVALLIPRFSEVSGWLIFLLMSVFLIAILSAWARGLNISCGCFGEALSSNSYVWLVIRDLVLLAGAAYIIILSRQRHLKSNS